MKSTAIHQHDDWYAVRLPGYGDIPMKELQIEVNVIDNDLINMDYKALRGAMILERFEEKNQHKIVEESLEPYHAFYAQQQKLDLINTMEDLMKLITTIPTRNDIYTR